MRGDRILVFGAALLVACGADDMNDEIGTVAQALAPQADLSVFLPGPTTVLAGATTTYQVQLRNTGTAAASSPVVTVQLPAGVTLAATGSGCAPGAPAQVLCTYADLASGGSIIRTFSLINPPVPGSMQLTAQATTTSQERSLTNNQATSLINVNSPTPVPIALVLPQTIRMKICFGVTAFANCAPGSFIENDMVLKEDNSIPSSNPRYAGVWSQPAGPASLRMYFFDVMSGATNITYEGTGVSSTCVEGAGAGPTVPKGAAFRACLK